ncbi:MAG: ABC transporter substrate-binding protein [Microbacteriaceae bacterium]|nr:ABC transporter substrate-binding protein [Microbacteriaceae bacterium]
MTAPLLRRATGLLAASAVALALTGCAGADAGTGSTDGADGAGSTTVRVLHAPIGYEPLVIAEQQGFFDEVNLDVEISRGGPPQDNLAQAVGGSADIITAAWDTMVTSTAEGMPVEILAGNSVVSGDVDTSGVVVRADSGLESLADLEGATVAFDNIGAGGTIEFYAALAEAGLEPTDLDIVALPYASMQVSLEQGQVDAVFPSDPFYAQIVADPANSVISNPVRETRAGLPITLWAATSEWLEANPEAAAAFIEAMERAIEFYEDPANLETVKEIRAEIAQVPIEEAGDALPAMRVAIDEEAGAAAIEQLVRFDRVTDPLTVDEIVWSGTPRV